MDGYPFDVLLARLTALLYGFWLRLLSPSGMRLLAPVLGVVVLYVGWRLWHRAERSMLGRAVRWWCLATVAAALLAGLVYLPAAGPEDPEAAALARNAAVERPGWPVFPAPLALAGSLAAALAALAAGWSWRCARLAPVERAQLAAVWRRVARPWRRRGALAVAVAAAAAGTAWAMAAAAPGQVPEPALLRTSAGARATLWVGTSAGLNRLAATSGGARWEALVRPRSPLPADHVTGIAPGPDGEVWVATHGGLARYAPRGGGAAWQVATVENAGLPYPTVLGLAVDARGAAWAATGHGAAVVDPRAGGRAFTAANAPLLHQILDAVYVDPAGRVWLGGAGGVNVYQPPLAPGASGEWIVGFNKQSTGGALPDSQVHAILGDTRGRLWFGTARGAAVFTPAPETRDLGAYDGSRWQAVTRANAPLAHDSVHAILEDRRGRIWLGTKGGLTVFEEAAPGAAAGRWQQFGAGGRGPEDSLPHQWVRALALGPDGRVWAGTRGGLAVYDPSQPHQGWSSYRAHALRRWTGYVWPAHWEHHLISDDVTAIAWAP